MKNKLIEKAMQVKTKKKGEKRKSTNLKDEVDLAILYLKGRVTARQCTEALDFKNPGSITGWAVTTIRNSLKYELIKIERL